MYNVFMNTDKPITAVANKMEKTLFRVTVSWDCIAENDDELNISEGEILDIVEIVEPGWWKARNQKGDVGLIPDNYVTLLSAGKISMILRQR